MPDPSFYSKLGRLSAIVTILPSAMGAGWLLGYFLVDKVFHSFPLGSVALGFLGAAAGFIEIYKLLTSEGGKN